MVDSTSTTAPRPYAGLKGEGGSGMISSTILTLVVIPVIFTIWLEGEGP